MLPCRLSPRQDRVFPRREVWRRLSLRLNCWRGAGSGNGFTTGLQALPSRECLTPRGIVAVVPLAERTVLLLRDHSCRAIARISSPGGHRVLWSRPDCPDARPSSRTTFFVATPSPPLLVLAAPRSCEGEHRRSHCQPSRSARQPHSPEWRNLEHSPCVKVPEASERQAAPALAELRDCATQELATA
jgi:hypothetical protein